MSKERSPEEVVEALFKRNTRPLEGEARPWCVRVDDTRVRAVTSAQSGLARAVAIQAVKADRAYRAASKPTPHLHYATPETLEEEPHKSTDHEIALAAVEQMNLSSSEETERVYDRIRAALEVLALQNLVGNVHD